VDCEPLVVGAQIRLAATRADIREHTSMDMIEQIKAGLLSHGSMAVIAVVGILALFLAIKIAHIIIRVLLVLVGLAAIGAAVWWFFLR
jgi:hypothetical protein